MSAGRRATWRAAAAICAAGVAACAPVQGPAAPHRGDLSVASAVEGRVFVSLREVQGDLVLSGAALQGGLRTSLERVTGDLVVRATALESLELPALATVGGALIVEGNPDLSTLTLPALRAVGGAQVIGNARLRGLEAPVLAESGGPWRVAENPELLGIAVPALTHLRGDLELVDLPGFRVWVADALAEVGGALRLERLERLTHLHGPRLAALGGELRISRCAALRVVDLPALVSVRGHLTAIDSPRLAAVSLRALAAVSGDVQFLEAEGLEELELPALTEVGGSVLLGPIAAPEVPLAVVQLRALARVGGEIDVHGTALPALALDALREAPGGLSVQGNRRLRELRLGGPLPAAAPVHIQKNDLDRCAADALLQVLGRGPSGVATGVSADRAECTPATSGAELAAAPLTGPLAAQWPAARACLHDAAAVGELAPGEYELSLTFDLGPGGEVARVELAKDLGSPAAVECALAAARAWRFEGRGEARGLRAGTGVRVRGPWRVGTRAGDHRVAAVLGVHRPPHEHAVTALTFGPKDTVLSGSLDGTVRTWALADGRLLGIRRGFGGAVRALAVGPGGELVVGGDDGVVRVIPPSGLPLARPAGAPVWSLAVVEGWGLLAGDARGRVQRWSWPGLEGPELLVQLPRDPDSTEAAEVVALVASGGAVLAASTWGQVQRVPAQAGAPVAPFAFDVGGWGRLGALASSRDGALAAGGGWGADEATVRWLDPDGARRRTSVQGDVHGLAFGPDGRLWVASDRGLSALPADGSAEVLVPGSEGVTRVAVAPAAGAVVTGDERGVVELRRGIAAPAPPLRVLQVNAAGETLVLREPERVQVWVPPAAEPRLALPLRATAVDWSLNADALLSGDAQGQVCSWTAPSGRQRFCRDLGEAVSLVRALDDGAEAVAVLADGALERFAVADGRRVSAAFGPPGTRVVDVSPDGLRVLSLTARGATVWSAKDGGVIGNLLLDGVERGRFAQGGVLLAGGRTLWGWDSVAPEPTFVRHEHARDIVDVAVSADGKRALTASLDGTVRLWDAVGGQVRGTWDLGAVPGDHPVAVAFSGAALVAAWSTPAVIVLRAE